MSRDRRLILKGSKEPLQALVDQARYQVELARKHGPALTEHNWQASQTDALASDIGTIDSDKFRQVEERAAAQGKTRVEAAAISEAKGLINKVRNVARQVVRKNPDAGVALEDFNAGGPLGRSAARISEYLGKLKVPVGSLDAAFTPYFKGLSLTKLLDDARARLDGASTAQEIDIAALPQDTAALYETKGRVLEQIEDLNAVARNAFSDEPETRAQFNKDLINRGRRKKATDGPVGPTPS